MILQKMHGYYKRTIGTHQKYLLCLKITSWVRNQKCVITDTHATVLQYSVQNKIHKTS